LIDDTNPKTGYYQLVFESPNQKIYIPPLSPKAKYSLTESNLV